jgi:hypothetical protein
MCKAHAKAQSPARDFKTSNATDGTHNTHQSTWQIADRTNAIKIFSLSLIMIGDLMTALDSGTFGVSRQRLELR